MHFDISMLFSFFVILSTFLVKFWLQISVLECLSNFEQSRLILRSGVWVTQILRVFFYRFSTDFTAFWKLKKDLSPTGFNRFPLNFQTIFFILKSEIHIQIMKSIISKQVIIKRRTSICWTNYRNILK